MEAFTHLSYIIDGIYLGSEFAATDVELLTQHQITAVLSLQAEAIYNHLYPNHFLYKNIPLHDGQSIDSTVFEEALAFIQQAQQENRKILVHCAAGVSRSPSIVAAYLMQVKGMNPIEALEFMQERRSIVQPAAECFLSAVEFAYPDIIWRCERCKGRWLYRSPWWLITSENTCDCQLPKIKAEEYK